MLLNGKDSLTGCGLQGYSLAPIKEYASAPCIGLTPVLKWQTKPSSPKPKHISQLKLISAAS